jgi:hypothetical protein
MKVFSTIAKLFSILIFIPSASSASALPEAAITTCSSGDFRACREALAALTPCRPNDSTCVSERIAYTQLSEIYARIRSVCATTETTPDCQTARRDLTDVNERMNTIYSAHSMNRVIKSIGIASRTWEWPDRAFRAGDCFGEHVNVTARSDGTGHLASVTYTTRSVSGDYWWWSITGYDANKVMLWNIPFQKGPKMNNVRGAGPRVHNDFDFLFDPLKYDNTAYVSISGKC